MVNTSTQTSSDTAKSAVPKKSTSSKRKVSARKNGSSAKSRGKNSQGMTAKLYRQGRDVMESAYDAASGIGSSLPKISGNLDLRKRGQSIYSAVENKPLIFGAVGLGVGIVLAALMPSLSNHNTQSSNRSNRSKR